MKYRFGITFNFEQYLKMSDPTNVFHDVDHYELLSEIVRFITEDVADIQNPRERSNEVEYLLNCLVDKGVIDNHILFQDEPYVKLCAILFSMCESIVELLLDTGFLSYCRSYREDEPKVIHISRDNYSIVVSPRRD